MCYSTMVERDIRKLERQYGAKIAYDSFREIYQMRGMNRDLRIPKGLDAFFQNIESPVSDEIRNLIVEHEKYVAEKRKSEIAATEKEIQELESKIKKKPTKTAEKDLGVKTRKLESLLKKNAASELPKISNSLQGTYRIYPFDFVPVVQLENGKRIVRPMRYRVLPKSGVEIPSKYNLFNARRDSIFHETKPGERDKIWKSMIGETHAVFPFVRFYEWVEGENGKSVEIFFTAKGFDSMWSAALFEETKTPYGLVRSFAMVTDDPPPEVRAAGHDRCPVFLQPDAVDLWLDPDGKTLKQLEALLDKKQDTYFNHEVAVAA
ncbi:MAG: SOS response-associated peptidase family protein [Bacteriovoracia bacterium]